MKYAIYPYSDDRRLYVKSIGLFRNDVDGLIAITTPSTRIIKDIDSDIQIYADFAEAVSKVEGIIFLTSEVYSDTFSKIKDSVNIVKKIVCCQRLKDNDICELRELCKLNNVEFELGEDDYSLLQRLDERNDPFYEMQTPIIGVSSLAKNIVTDEAVIGLTLALKRKGYKVLSVSNSRDLFAFGFFDMPIELFWKETKNFDNFVIAINRYVNWLQMKARPDVIIVQTADEGIVPISSSLSLSFGVCTYALSQALPIDYNVIFSPNGLLDEEGFERLGEQLHYRFGFGIDAVCIDDRVIDYVESKNQGEIIYRRIESNPIDVSSSNIIFTDKYNIEGYELIANDFINKCGDD